MKRRKKISSTSDFSSDSLSPKKHIPNSFSEDYRSSPETTFNTSFHSILAGQIGSLDASNSHIKSGSDDSMQPIHETNLNVMDVSQNGSNTSAGGQSPMDSSDDSNRMSSTNKSHRQPRTPEDFYLFCQFILEYANYNEMCSQEVSLARLWNVRTKDLN